jgi:2,3-bisphosphoglycerate-independent phosphoglycerate mutase
MTVEVTDAVLKEIESGIFDVIVLNFANPDMVGHTGIMEAAVKAVETIDYCLARIVDEIRWKKGIILITADHGNVEQMTDCETGQPHTAHTVNPVPFIYVNDTQKNVRLEAGKLEDIVPTMLMLLGLEIPTEMTGKCLIHS